MQIITSRVITYVGCFTHKIFFTISTESLKKQFFILEILPIDFRAYQVRCANQSLLKYGKCLKSSCGNGLTAAETACLPVGCLSQHVCDIYFSPFHSRLDFELHRLVMHSTSLSGATAEGWGRCAATITEHVVFADVWSSLCPFSLICRLLLQFWFLNNTTIGQASISSHRV